MKRSQFPSLLLATAVAMLSSCDSSSNSSKDDTSPPDGSSEPQEQAVVAPSFSPGGGTYAVKQSVALTSGTSGATIYYTTDGSTPKTSSTKYLSPVAVSSSMTLKAFAVKSGMANSSVASALYTISDPTTPDASTFGIPWNSVITYGTLNDSRDGKIYRTVKIGTQTWMAENLNYTGATGAVGVCFKNSIDSCAKYGRLYLWPELMNDSSSSAASPSGVHGLCPSGWHVPSDAEWDTLMTAVGGRDSAVGKLKSTIGWYSSGNGMDSYGFRALPGGYVSDGSHANVGSYGRWWSATGNGASRAWFRDVYCSRAFVLRDNHSKTDGFSARCLKD